MVITSKEIYKIIPAQEPKQLKLGWSIREYIGGEVLKEVNGQPLLKESDLQPEDHVVVPTMFGYSNGIIKKNSFGQRYIQIGENYGASLEFSQDDRKCWISSCTFNLKGIKRLFKKQISYCKRCNIQNEYMDFNPDWICYSCRS